MKDNLKSKILMAGSSPKFLKLSGLILCISFSIFYNLIFFNKYFPLTEGWFSSYAELVNRGLIPYRDFYLFLTPLYPLQIALFQDIFGNSFLALRILGIVITTLILIFLYFILNRKFSPLASVIGATTAYIYYRSGVAFINYDFTQVLTLYALIAIYCILKWSDDRSEQSSRFYLFLSGIFLSLTVLTKQSNGIFIAFFCGLAVFCILIKRSNFAYFIRQSILFMAGISLPAALLIGYLVSEGGIQSFIAQVLFGAMSSKGGGIKEVIFGWILRLDLSYLISRVKLIFAVTAFLYVLNLVGGKFKIQPTQVRRSQGFLLIIFIASLMFLITMLVHFPHRFQIVMRLLWLEQAQLNFDLLIIAILVSSFYSIWMKFHSAPIPDGFIVVSLATMGLILGNGTSAGISEISLFIILAYLVAYVFSFNQLYGFYKITVVVFSYVLILGYTQDKLNSPYAWWYVDEPSIRQSTEVSTLKLLSGFELSPKTRDLVDGVVSAVTQNSSTDEDVFVFPNISGIYTLANRWPHSKVIVPWFDFLPDILAIKEAGRILDTPPVVIVNLKLPDEAWTLHEKYFRKNGRLGQRDIYKAIEYLTLQSKQYKLVFSRHISQGVDVEVWALKRSLN